MSLVDEILGGGYNWIIGEPAMQIPFDAKSDPELTQVAMLTQEIDSLKSLLRSAHYLLQDCPGETWESEFQKWLTAYSSLTSSKSGMGA